LFVYNKEIGVTSVYKYLYPNNAGMPVKMPDKEIPIIAWEC